ncbi:MAG: D-alanyl-D-alanine dipeptidase [Actinobacteria bacterium]|nr:D-alanyl-D-alanine dipeptidase [Actinomycetota bacterium]
MRSQPMILALLGVVAALALTACASQTAELPAGFTRLSEVAPDIVQEIRYNGEHNFMGRPVTGYNAPQCWLTTEAAQALAEVQAAVKTNGYSLKVYDCYRPQRAVNDFVEWAKDPGDDVTRGEFYPRLAKDQLFPLGLIAAKSGHSRGSTVDVTLVPLGSTASPQWAVGDPIVDCAAPVGERFADTSIDMGTGFDCFDPLAATASPDITAEQRANRQLLVSIMEAAGFVNLPEEWWHYTLANEPFPKTFFDPAIQ